MKLVSLFNYQDDARSNKHKINSAYSIIDTYIKRTAESLAR